MGTSENKAISSQFINDVFNNGQYEVVDDLLAENFVAHVSGSDRPRSELKDMVRAYRNGFQHRFPSLDGQLSVLGELGAQVLGQ